MLISKDDLSSQARVWIYQADRVLTAAETTAIREQLHRFAQQWTTHGTPVPAFADIYYNAFIVLLADIPPSGCSIDSSVHLLKEIEQQYQISLFNRLLTAYFDGAHLCIAHPKDLKEALQNGQITLQTPIFNHLVQTRSEWETKWQMPIAQSWLASQVGGKQ